MKVADFQINQPIRPLKSNGQKNLNQSVKQKTEKNAFGQLLQNTIQQTNDLKFSAHALKRLELRQLNLSPMDLQRLQHGVQKLEAKGARNSVILMDDRAFVISVQNRTVVTAIDQNQSDQKIFTNIDSLAIV